MAELTGVDVEEFTSGRLQASSEQVELMLQAALVVCRRRTGWHVSPVISEELTLDGPESRVLWLPSQKVVSVISVAENGTPLNVSTVNWSRATNRHAAMRKRGGGFWTGEYGGIEIEMEHGFSEFEAADWRRAVLSLVDQMSLVPVKATTGFSEAGLRSKQVDDVVYRWDSYVAMAEEVVFSVENTLANYALAWMEFV